MKFIYISSLIFILLGIGYFIWGPVNYKTVLKDKEEIGKLIELHNNLIERVEAAKELKSIKSLTRKARPISKIPKIISNEILRPETLLISSKTITTVKRYTSLWNIIGVNLIIIIVGLLLIISKKWGTKIK